MLFLKHTWLTSVSVIRAYSWFCAQWLCLFKPCWLRALLTLLYLYLFFKSKKALFLYFELYLVVLRAFFLLTPVGYRRSIWRGIRDRNWEGTWGASVLPTLLSICFNKQGFLSVFFECRLLIFLQNICLSDLFSAHNPFGFYVSISPFSYS